MAKKLVQRVLVEARARDFHCVTMYVRNDNKVGILSEYWPGQIPNHPSTSAA